MDIGAWLRNLGLERYEPAFRENEIDAEVLPRLTPEDLTALGVTAIGHRRKLLDAIAALRDGRPLPGSGSLVADGPELAKDAAAPTLPAGERRQVAVLFADLAGYTALSQELDAEEVHALLERFFDRADRIVEDHGGRIDKHIGDCVMAVFGAPAAHGNDAERAVRASLALRDDMPALTAEVGRPIRVHVGIAAGQVVASGIGSAGYSEYAVTGESVNLASRLTDAAAADEILISDGVRRALAERLDCLDAGALEVKGFAEPMRAWRLRGLRAAVSDQRPLVGRRNELHHCLAMLAACREAGCGQALYLRGEAGIGKTRLVQEFRLAAREAGFACHTGLVLDFGTGTGRDAIRALVRDLLGLALGSGAEAARAAADRALAADLVAADDAVFLNDLLDLPQPIALRAVYDAMDNGTRDRGRQRTVTRLVERASQAQPRLLIVEDLHWADRTTLMQLARLTSVVTRCLAVLVMTSRIEGDPLDRDWRVQTDDAPLVTVDLAPLRPDEALSLASRFVATADKLITRCVERAAGNPLFLEQLLYHAEEVADAGVPGSVQSLMQARVDRLDPADKAALQAASVLGQRFEREVVAHLLGRDGYDPERLVAHLLIRPQGESLLFAHALIRDAVYDTLLKSRRRELHRRAADWFAQRDPMLHAEHLDRAEDPAAPRAYLAAARSAAEGYRYELAQRLVERGQALAALPADRFALRCLHGDVLHDLGAMSAAASAYESAMAAAASDAERCRVWLGLAAVKRVTDDLEGASAHLDRAEIAAVEQGLMAEQARSHFLRGNLLFPRGDIEGCVREHRRSLDLAQRAGSTELEAMALGGIGDAEYMRGRMISAHEGFRRCIELARQHGLGRIEVANWPMAAITRWYTGEAVGALDDALAAIAAAAKVGHQRAEMIGHHAAYFSRREMLETEGASDHVEEALALAQRLGARRFEAEALAFRGELKRIAGRRAEALSDVGEALTISRETGMAFIGGMTLGILALAADDPQVRDDALAEGEALLAAGAVSHNHLHFRRDAIDACLDAGDWSGAELHSTALESYTQTEPLPWADFFVARGRALAACGRGRRDAGLVAELTRLAEDGKRLAFKLSLPAVETALAGVMGR
jgi:class 3 adenylate cyclase/tetratricopeptide (TPR) repeat protein